MKKTIYIFGNPLLEFDNLPIRLVPMLERYFPTMDFIIRDPNENLRPVNKELVIIDTVVGIDSVTVITDIDSLAQNTMYSLHDLDLGFNLKLLKKIGQLEKIFIIGVPPTLSFNDALIQVSDIIASSL